MRLSIRLAPAVVLLVIAIGCSSTTTTNGSGNEGASSSSGGGASSSGDSPTVEEVAEVEPNNGPDRSGMQDLGAFSEPKTLKVTGKLDTGGNDGTQYTGDFDAFVFSVAQSGGTLAFDIDWNGDADVDVGIYDANGKLVAGDASTTKPISRTGAAPAGSYAVALYSKDLPAEWTMTMTYTKPQSGSGGSCVSTVEAIPGNGGCTFTMNEPAQNGQAITLPYTFGWRSDGCETPGKVVFFGNPPSAQNSIAFQYTRGGQMSLLNVTGQHVLTADDLAQLTSDNGVYHWALESFYGQRSEGRTFTIAPKTCQ